MRILGELDHPIYKITVLEMNSKVTIQFEKDLKVVSFKFRDNDWIKHTTGAKEFTDKKVLKEVDEVFTKLNAIQEERFQRRLKSELDELPNII